MGVALGVHTGPGTIAVAVQNYNPTIKNAPVRPTP